MPFPRQLPGIPLRSEFHELRIDVVYDQVDGVPLRYDHYRPLKATEPAPAVVFVHGGGWTHGDPSQAAGNALHFARRGIATIAISYRLAPEHRFPAPLDDVRRGLRHVRANAAALGVDPDRLALLGLSAGAHLSMLAHLSNGIPALASAGLPDVSERVRAVMVHYGPYDLGRRKSEMVDSLIGPRVEDAEWVRLASPLYHAEHATAPVLLIHGNADQLVSWRESSRMHDALTAASKPSELLILEGAPHAFQVDWRSDANRRANEAMDRFLDRHLLGG
jgi:acetyl esterase/lipase